MRRASSVTSGVAATPPCATPRIADRRTSAREDANAARIAPCPSPPIRRSASAAFSRARGRLEESAPWSGGTTRAPPAAAAFATSAKTSGSGSPSASTRRSTGPKSGAKCATSAATRRLAATSFVERSAATSAGAADGPICRSIASAVWRTRGSGSESFRICSFAFAPSPPARREIDSNAAATRLALIPPIVSGGAPGARPPFYNGRAIPRHGRNSLLATALVAALCASCRSPEKHRAAADEAAYSILDRKRKEVLDKEEPFRVERPSDTLRRRLLLGQELPRAGDESLGTDALKPVAHWPKTEYPGAGAKTPPPPWTLEGPLRITLVEALEIGARNSREYQEEKESVFLSALDLDLERDRFRNTFFGLVGGTGTADLSSPDAPDGVEGSAEAGVSRLLRNGALLAGSIGVNLVKLLTGDRSSSLGIFGDATVTIPLLRGAGRHVVEEPLTQAEREVAYALRSFERFRHVFAVEVARSYFDVLQQLDGAANAEENYRGLALLTRRAQALVAAGRLPGIQVDQARQDELRARDRWISSLESCESRLDSLKTTLGLPPDARMELDREELTRVSEEMRRLLDPEGAVREEEPVATTLLPADARVELPPPGQGRRGPMEIDEGRAIAVAIGRREDLLVARGRVVDAQRRVAVAADALRAGLTLAGGATLGSRRTLATAGLSDASLSPSKGTYTADLLLDLPFERTAERNAYRESFLDLEASVRDLQALEDRIKADVRATLRSLLQAREGVLIQARAVVLARSRVESTNLFLEAGRAEVRDVLEAQEALVSAQNALTAAFVRYRVAELELQRDTGVLEVGENGLWKEVRFDG